MPVYLCKPGWASSEPWRHGVQVYAYPFHIDEGVGGGVGANASYQHHLHHPQAAAAASSSSASTSIVGGTTAAHATAAAVAVGGQQQQQPQPQQGRGNNGGVMLPVAAAAAAEGWPVPLHEQQQQHRNQDDDDNNNNAPRRNDDETIQTDNRSTPADVVAAAAAAAVAGVPQPIQPPSSSNSSLNSNNRTILSPTTGVAVRRVRHAEVVLVDEVSIAYGRYWLRLRWPGPQGGFAGYIALGAVRRQMMSPTQQQQQQQPPPPQNLKGGIGGGGEEEEEGMEEEDEAVAVANATKAVIEEAEKVRRGRTLSRQQLSEVSDNPPTRQNSPLDPNTETPPPQPTYFSSTTTTTTTTPRTTTATSTNTSEESESESTKIKEEAPVKIPLVGRRDASPGSELEDDVATSPSSPTSSPSSSSSAIHPIKKCESTGLYFPSSTAMELMAMYDDGLDLGGDDDVKIEGGNVVSSVVASGVGAGGMCTIVKEDGSNIRRVGSSSGVFLGQHQSDSGEPVFCRICREGLHDVNYDLDPVTSGAKQQSNPVVMPPPPPPPLPHMPAVAAAAAAQPPRNRNDAAGMDVGGRPILINNNHNNNHNNIEGLRQRRVVGFQNRDQPEGTEEEERVGILHNATAAAAGNEHQNERDAAPRTAHDLMLHHHQSAAAAAAAAASTLITHHPTAENPLLAPCECSGSMAFVHYLCVEQWRCRSRHPAARNGLNCETCGGEYTLPPPPSRPASRRSGDGADGAGNGNAGVFADEDWLEAMPAHVLAALRRPHPWWQIGAAIVRRRWLRPIAPVLVSPVVALYCRARRTLKKRGVSRRRWACSLCRRRARWKCVRCLRSYYCSRQCQNVSWHIVHKHVCYKPARFWWSVVVYGVGAALSFPGILRDPLIYDLGLSFVPASFLIMGILGGGVATALKKGFGVDIRGRVLEVIVVLCTMWLAMVSWGLVWAFFGVSNQCWGVFGQWSENNISSSGESNNEAASKIVRPLLYGLRHFVFNPARVWFSMCNRAASKTGPLAKWICSAENFMGEDSKGCFQTAGNANPDFFMPEFNGEKCAADLITVASFWGAAGAVLVAGSVLKRRERDRRAAGRGGGGRVRGGRNHGEPRPHQD